MQMNRYWIAILSVALAMPVLAQQPKVSNTQFAAETVTGDLAAKLDTVAHSHDSVWAGYEIQALARTHLTTCSSGNNPENSDDGCCGEFHLEDHEYSNNDGKNTPEVQSIYVLLRFEAGQVIKMRPVPVNCHINADGVAFTWLNGVTQEQSIAYLEKLATQDSSAKRAVDGAMMVLSYHGSPEATRALDRVATSSAPMHTREEAAFWLGVMRGHDGYVALKELADKSNDTALREKLPFDFSQNSDPAAEDELMSMAKNDADLKVREQAIFWIAQKAGRKAVGAISDAIANDPETDVKKRAVFALSQLPKDEGVPQLIHVADTNHNPVVRKEAIFWLGQSHDPRALEYLEAVLKR